MTGFVGGRLDGLLDGLGGGLQGLFIFRRKCLRPELRMGQECLSVMVQRPDE